MKVKVKSTADPRGKLLGMLSREFFSETLQFLPQVLVTGSRERRTQLVKLSVVHKMKSITKTAAIKVDQVGILSLQPVPARANRSSGRLVDCALFLNSVHNRGSIVVEEEDGTQRGHRGRKRKIRHRFSNQHHEDGREQSSSAFWDANWSF